MSILTRNLPSLKCYFSSILTRNLSLMFIHNHTSNTKLTIFTINQQFHKSPIYEQNLNIPKLSQVKFQESKFKKENTRDHQQYYFHTQPKELTKPKLREHRR